MMVKAIKHGAHTNMLLTRLHTPCHSSCCTSFSAPHSCFPMFFSCASILHHFLGYKEVLNLSTNMFSVLEFCCGHPVATLNT